MGTFYLGNLRILNFQILKNSLFQQKQLILSCQKIVVPPCWERLQKPRQVLVFFLSIWQYHSICCQANNHLWEETTSTLKVLQTLVDTYWKILGKHMRKRLKALDLGGWNTWLDREEHFSESLDMECKLMLIILGDLKLHYRSLVRVGN